MSTLRSVAIGSAGCAISVAAFLFVTGYAGDVEVSRRIDSGPPALLVAALTIDLLLLGLCALTLWPGSTRHSTEERPKSAAGVDEVAAPVQRPAGTVALALDRPVDPCGAPGNTPAGPSHLRPADRSRRPFPPLAPQLDPIRLPAAAPAPASPVPVERRELSTTEG